MLQDILGWLSWIFWILCCIGVLCLLPYVRIFCKRIVLYVRLRRICRKKGYKMYGTHFGWLFSPWWYPKHDFVIEGDHVIYPVKLFAAKSKTRRLVFTTEGTFYWVSFMMLLNRMSPVWANLELPGKYRKLPRYDFNVETDVWSSVQIRPILLVHPICWEFRREYIEYNHKETELLGSWESIDGMYLCSSARLLDEVETYDHEKFLYR